MITFTEFLDKWNGKYCEMGVRLYFMSLLKNKLLIKKNYD